MVIDTHTHAWGPPSSAHPWTNGPLVADSVDSFDVDAVYTAEKLLTDMDRHGIDEAVVVGYPIVDWTDNWYTVDCVDSHDRLYGITMIDQFAENAADTLREHMAVDGILGFRLGAICPYDRMWETVDPGVTWLRDAIDEEAFWNAAIETDATVQILAHVDQLDQAIELVDTYPELDYLFDHFAHTSPGTSPGDAGLSRFEELAAYDGVAVKVSSISYCSDEEFPYADMHEHVRWFVDTFGRERVCWGSDFPNVSTDTTYAESRHWLNMVDGLSATDREWITGRAFREHLDLD